MLYYNEEETSLGFLEIPTEISLCIVMLGCKIGCKHCHSKHNWSIDTKVDKVLDVDAYISLLNKHEGQVSCITFMGGEWDYKTLITYCILAHNKGYKTALYTGLDKVNLLNKDLVKVLDYIKVGHYDKELGGLNKVTSNQKLYYNGVDITNKFKKD